MSAKGLQIDRAATPLRCSLASFRVSSRAPGSRGPFIYPNDCRRKGAGAR